MLKALGVKSRSFNLHPVHRSVTLTFTDLFLTKMEHTHETAFKQRKNKAKTYSEP